MEKAKSMAALVNSFMFRIYPSCLKIKLGWNNNETIK
jgi:hypothetical protein